MSATLDRFVQHIMAQMDGTPQEKEDTQDEMMIHLQLATEQWIKADYDKKTAKQMAMADFGEAKDIGNAMQEAMFPFRRKLFLTLAILSLIFTFLTYFAQLFIQGDAHIGWLLLSVLTSSSLLFYALHMVTTTRKAILNTMLLVHIFVYVYGGLLGLYIENSLATSFAIFACFIIGMAIFLIYRTTIYDYQYTFSRAGEKLKVFHALNITYGIGAITLTLFYMWVFLVFAESFEIQFLIFLIPVIVWLIFYMLQIKLVEQNKWKYASLLAFIFPFFCIITIIRVFIY